jgi:hypothetical protein
MKRGRECCRRGKSEVGGGEGVIKGEEGRVKEEGGIGGGRVRSGRKKRKREGRV